MSSQQSFTDPELQRSPGAQAIVEMKPVSSGPAQPMAPTGVRPVASPGQLAARVTVRRIRRRREASTYALLLGRRNGGTGISRRAGSAERADAASA